MPANVTIATVARHANVSRQTVSNVLNSPDLVRAETRDRVRAAIEELGYRTNLAARQMRTGRSRLIAVRIDPVRDGIETSVLDRFLHGLTEASAPAGYRVMLYTATDDRTEIATYEDLLASYALDAFVLTHTHHGDSRTAWLAEPGVPFVTFGRPWGGVDQHPWVDVDGAAGTAAATRHLLAAGPPADRIPRLAQGIRRRRRPAAGLGDRDAGGRVRRGPARPAHRRRRRRGRAGRPRPAAQPAATDRAGLRQRPARPRRPRGPANCRSSASTTARWRRPPGCPACGSRSPRRPPTASNCSPRCWTPGPRTGPAATGHARPDTPAGPPRTGPDHPTRLTRLSIR